MPAQKHSNDALYEDDDYVDLQRNNLNIPDESEDEEADDDGEQDEREESVDDGSPSSDCSDKDEFVLVKLAEVRKEVQCPICLGIIRKTRTVMECLHRFCRECIDKSMRLGNNECPACRAHCASRRSLRDDPNYDALIAALYPDVDTYEAEEFAFHEEEKARNKQIQASIAQTSRRQLEALGKKGKNPKPTTAVFTRRSQGSNRALRGRRSRKSAEPQGSDNEDDADNNDGGKDFSSAEEPRPKRYKRWGHTQSSQPSSSADDETEATRESAGASGGLAGGSEILVWGRGGMRSHTRNNSGGKNGRNNRVPKMIDHLQNSPQNDDKLDINIKVIALDEQNIANLEYLYLRCSLILPIKQVLECVAAERGLQGEEMELLLVKGDHSEVNPLTGELQAVGGEQAEPVVINPLTGELQLLEEHQTLLDITQSSGQNNVTLAYRKKSSG